MEKKIRDDIAQFERTARIAKCPDCKVWYSVKHWSSSKGVVIRVVGGRMIGEAPCPLTATHEIYKWKNSFAGQLEDALMRNKNKLVDVILGDPDAPSRTHSLEDI